MEAIGPKRSSPSADPADLVCKVMVLNSHSRNLWWVQAVSSCLSVNRSGCLSWSLVNAKFTMNTALVDSGGMNL